MNLPEPSGSSPPENPPGRKTIWAFFSFSVKALTDSVMAAAVRLRSTRISGSAPASANALALSYSQLVPGNTGMSTFGFAVFRAGEG